MSERSVLIFVGNFLNSPKCHPLKCAGETGVSYIGNPDLIREAITISITIKIIREKTREGVKVPPTHVPQDVHRVLTIIFL